MNSKLIEKKRIKADRLDSLETWAGSEAFRASRQLNELVRSSFEKSGLCSQELARTLEWPLEKVLIYQRGKRVIPFRDLFRICNCLNISPLRISEIVNVTPSRRI